MMMLMVLTTLFGAALFGAALGMRFNLFIIFPAMAICVIVIALAEGNSLWTTAVAMMLGLTGLQMGYFAGTFIRFVASSRMQRGPEARNHASIATAGPVR